MRRGSDRGKNKLRLDFFFQSLVTYSPYHVVTLQSALCSRTQAWYKMLAIEENSWWKEIE